MTTTTYTVRSGDTLSGLADRLGVDADALMRANGMDPSLADGRVSRSAADPDRLMPGQRLRIPSATEGYETEHTVHAGETLGGIAERWGVDLRELLAANPQFDASRVGGRVDTRRGTEGSWDPDALRIGDVIRRPTGGGTPPVVGNPVVAPANPPVNQPAAGGRLDLQAFLNPAAGTNAAAAIVIGNAEGTRTPDGGTTAAFRGHTDPGNAASNLGSFSYQHGASSAAQADRLQLQRLDAQRPAYEAAARAAGLDPADARLATAYFDLFNQSPTAAARFLDQLPRLAGQALTPERMVQARFDAFVNPETGQRFTNPNGLLAGGGFANIARNRLGHEPSEADVQATIRADQLRRTDAMERALDTLGLMVAGPAPVTEAPPASNDEPPWLTIARGELGTNEIRGGQHSARVLDYHATTSLRARDDETAWCSSFVNWTMEQAGYRGTDSAAARSWSTWGQAVERDTGSVRPGDVIVFPRGSNPAFGHVGIVSAVHADGTVTVLGGNQGNGRGQPDGVNEATRALSEAVAVRRPTEAQRQP
jgi:uncharacterized protein (TIGR02594 family)